MLIRPYAYIYKSMAASLTTRYRPTDRLSERAFRLFITQIRLSFDFRMCIIALCNQCIILYERKMYSKPVCPMPNMCQISIGHLFGKRDHKWRWLAIFRHKINSHSLKYWLNFIVWAIIFIIFAFSQLSQQEKNKITHSYITHIYLACRRRTCMWITRNMNTWWNRHTTYRPAIGIVIDKNCACVFLEEINHIHGSNCRLNGVRIWNSIHWK